MSINSGLMSSATDEWATPQGIFDELNREFRFTLDPCATAENAKCERFYTRERDGLQEAPWTGERVFMNPPYGRDIGYWVEKAYDTACEPDSLVVCLLPARTDTAWWHTYCMWADEIRFVRGRIRFGRGDAPAPFPSAVVVFDRLTECAPVVKSWKPLFGQGVLDIGDAA